MTDAATQMLWVERRFNFDLPLSLFPGILERLRGTPARVEERVRGIAPPHLVRREGETWSIQENIGHLIEVEALWLGRLDDFAADLKELRPADMTNRKTFAADYNERSLDQVTAAFRSVRHKLVAGLESLEAEAIGHSALHPRLNQPMRVLDMMVFAAEHDDHHLARISTLMRLLDAC